MLFKSLLVCFVASQLVAGHGAIVKVVGDQGGSGTALGSKYQLWTLSFQADILKLMIALHVMEQPESHSSKTLLDLRTLLLINAVRLLEVEPMIQQPKSPK